MTTDGQIGNNSEVTSSHSISTPVTIGGFDGPGSILTVEWGQFFSSGYNPFSYSSAAEEKMTSSLVQQWLQRG